MPFVTCMGNPFLEDSVDLTLDTIDIMDEEVVMSITNVYNTGLEQYTLFVQERLRDQTKNISDPIKKEQTTLFQKDLEQNGLSSCCSERRLFGRQLWGKSNPGR